MSVESLVVAALPEPRLIGYARVSTDDQDLSLQIDALTKQGIPETSIFSELELSKDEIAEIEFRFEALKPYQKPGAPDFAPAVQREGS